MNQQEAPGAPMHGMRVVNLLAGMFVAYVWNTTENS